MRPVVAVPAYVVFFAAVVALVSCSGDPHRSASSDAGSGGPLGDEASRFVTDFCAVSQPCCARLASASETCIIETQAFGRGKSFDPAKARFCLDTLQAEAEEAKSDAYCGRGPDSVVCTGVFKRADAKGPGEPCQHASDCADAPLADGLCVGSTGNTRCLQVRRGAAGDACIGTRQRGRTEEPQDVSDIANALCFATDGLHCDAVTAKCAKRGAVSAACTPNAGDDECVDAAWCNPDTRECTARTTAGAPCRYASECALGNRCDNDGSSGARCAPFVGAGGACVRGNECDPTAGLVCDPNLKTCAADKAVYERTCSGAVALDH